MNSSIFLEVEFFILIIVSIIIPIFLYVYLWKKKAISRKTVLFFGIVLVMLAAIDVFLLKRLDFRVHNTSSLIDDMFFSSELSLALYIFPVVFAGIGVNLISHVLIGHLKDAELKYDNEHK